MSGKIAPKNWQTFQHYRDRKPAWIKLHHSILDDYEFQRLPVASRALAPCLWLLASEYEGGDIPADWGMIAFRLRMTADEVEEAITPLIRSGFFVASGMLAEPEQKASLEREREIEKEREIYTHSQASPSNVTCAQARGEPNGFADFYSLFPNKVGKPKAAAAYAAAIRRGATASEIESGLRMYIANKPPERQWLNPATFLNQDRFRDQPASVLPQTDHKNDRKKEFWNAFDRVDHHFNSYDEQGDIVVPFRLTSN